MGNSVNGEGTRGKDREISEEEWGKLKGRGKWKKDWGNRSSEVSNGGKKGKLVKWRMKRRKKGEIAGV